MSVLDGGTPWALPSDWKWQTIGKITDYVSRGRSPSYVDADGVRVLNQKCVRWGRIDVSHSKQTDAAKALRLSEEQRVLPDDILWNSTGTGTIGRAAIARPEDLGEITLADSHITIVRAGQALEPRWLFHWIASPFVQAVVTGIGSTNQIELAKGTVLGLSIPCPTLATQRRIVARIDELLSDLDDGEEELRRAREELETYRKSLLKAAVTGELTADWRAANPPKESGADLLQRILVDRRIRWEADPKNKGKKYQEPTELAEVDLPNLPEGWTWASLDQLISERERSFQSGPFGSELRHSEFQEVGKLVIGIDNVQDGFFSEGSGNRISEAKFGKLVRFKARPEDVLITVMATIGRTCVLPEDIEDGIITKHVYRMTMNRDAVLPQFVNAALRGHPATRAHIFGKVQGQTRPGLNKGILEKTPIPIGSLEEQGEAIRIFRLLFDAQTPLVDAIELIEAAALRQSILGAAFRGELA